MRPGPLSFTSEREQTLTDKAVTQPCGAQMVLGPVRAVLGALELLGQALMVPRTATLVQGENESIKTNVQRCVPMRCMPIRDTHP